MVLWVLTVMIINIPGISEPSLFKGEPSFLRLWWEFIPFLGIIAVTILFCCVIEKRKISIALTERPVKDTILGFFLGIGWILIPIAVLVLFKIYNFTGTNTVTYILVWFIAALINAIMQEYLVRGYLFSLIREKYNAAAAIIVTTVFFTAMHGGAFEAGLIPVLNVVTMSFFASLLLIYTGGLLAPILVHFLWNSLGCLIFGSVSLADDYPNIFNISVSGNQMISGGTLKLEGSIVTLIINVFLIGIVMFMIVRKKRK